MFRFLALRPRGSTWIWSDGDELSYENWGPDQPVAGHACVRMRDDGMWYSEPSEECDQPSAFICLKGRYSVQHWKYKTTIINQIFEQNAVYRFTWLVRCIDINECSPEVNPCQNQGACLNNLGSYRCGCVTGFEGQHCDQGKISYIIQLLSKLAKTINSIVCFKRTTS